MYTDNRGGEEVLCVPHTKIMGNTVIAMIIAQAHQTLGHLGAQQTADYIRRWYWWPNEMNCEWQRPNSGSPLLSMLSEMTLRPTNKRTVEGGLVSKRLMDSEWGARNRTRILRAKTQRELE